MRYVFGLVLMCNALVLFSQELFTVYDTSFYSQDSSYVLLVPEYVEGELYTYEVIDYNLRVKDGDTLTNRNSVSQFSFLHESANPKEINIELFLEDEYWKKIILFDSLYSSWTNDSIPEVHLKYLHLENNFNLENHEPISDYIKEYIHEAKNHFENDSLADTWDVKVANTYFDKCKDSTVVRNWLTFSSDPWTLFTYYSFMFPENKQVRYELKQKRDGYSTSTYYLVTKDEIENGNLKFTISEDLEKGKNSSDRRFDRLLESFSDLDTSYTSRNYKSETVDETYVIVNPKGIILEATSRSIDRTILASNISESISEYTIRLVND